MSEPAPVILCGKTTQIGEGVIANLKPEYEVVHFIMSPEEGKVAIPAILRGEAPPNPSNDLGSKNYSRPPVAVLTGAGYDEQGVEVMRTAAKGLKPRPWLRPDTTKPAPPLGPEYVKALVERIKVTLKELAEKGEMNEDKIVWY